METIQKQLFGTFCWSELMSSDAGKSKEFYANVLGYTYKDMPMGEGVYSMAVAGTLDAGGIFQMSAEQAAQGIPSNWTQYIFVESIAKTIEKAVELGGTVVVPETVMSEHGKFAVLQDTTGAYISIWESLRPSEEAAAMGIGTPGWRELGTTDASKALEFYKALFGYGVEIEKDEATGAPYYILTLGEDKVGGIFQMTEDMQGIPPHWLVYITIEDCDLSTQKAVDAGAKILVPKVDLPKVGQFTVIQDPQGAVLALMQWVQS